MKIKNFISIICLATFCIFQTKLGFSHWADKSLTRWVNYIKVANQEENLLPDSPINRAETATIISQFLWRQRVFEICARIKEYNDLKESDWYYYWINNVVSQKLMFGTGNNYFGARDLLTREEAATILYRIFESSLIVKDNKLTFSDEIEISSWSKEAVTVLTGNGIIKGYSDGSFKPKNGLTCAEFVVLLDRLYDSQIINQPSAIANVDKENPDWAMEDTKIVTLGEGKAILLKHQMPTDILPENIRKVAISWRVKSGYNLTNGFGPSIKVSPLTKNWESYECTWNDISEYISEDESIVFEPMIPIYNIDITNIVKKWISNIISNNGIIVEGIGNEVVVFYAEQSDNTPFDLQFYPQLYIEYTPCNLSNE